jgi:hypothetical protein
MPRNPNQIYQIKVTLNETHPPIWRRIQVPANITLLKLHDILQIVMGWEGYHLHMFTIEGSVYGDPADDEFGDQGTLLPAGSLLSAKDSWKRSVTRLSGNSRERMRGEYAPKQFLDCATIAHPDPL